MPAIVARTLAAGSALLLRLSSMTRGRLLVVALAVSGVVACSLTSLEGFAGSDGSTVTTSDSSTEGSSSESSTSNDSGTQGGSDGEAADSAPAARFCEQLKKTNPKVVFCDDFDEPGRMDVASASPIPWADDLDDGTGSHGSLVEVPVSFSPPRAAKIEMATATGDPSRAWMTQTVGFSGKRVSMHLKFKGTDGIALGIKGGCYLAFNPVGGSAAAFCDDGSQPATPQAAGAGKNTWRSLTYGITREVNDAGKPMLATVFIQLDEGQGALFYEAKIGKPIWPNIEFLLGQGVSDYGGTFLYDDVYIEIE
jgi:hypothetical protein